MNNRSLSPRLLIFWLRISELHVHGLVTPEGADYDKADYIGEYSSLKMKDG